MGGAFSEEGWNQLALEETKMAVEERETNLLEKMYYINDIESENGQNLFRYVAQKIRETSGDAESGKSAKLTNLPWEDLESKDLETRVRKGVFGLSKEVDLLTQLKSEHEFEFDFNMEKYAFISIALLKYDRNLADSREKLVPQEVNEENFWRNYYY